MKFFRGCVLLFFILFACRPVLANHLIGGELQYKHLSGNTYQVNLTLYGDCFSSALGLLRAASPDINLYNGSTFVSFIRLALDTTTITEVSPVCPSEINHTACKGGSLPGILRYTFSNIINMPFKSAKWRFLFEGNMTPSQAGRTNSITNIDVLGGSSVMYLEATLNNMNGDNNSPAYTSIPTPFFCNNKAQQYNQGASDSDGDSLSFSLVQALQGSVNASGTGTPVNYITPYTPTEPLATTAGTFSFNTSNGQMNFTPNLAQVSLVVNKVEEYKDGILVGSSMREMTFVVINDCQNTPPSASIDSTIEGGAKGDATTINVCRGVQKLKFSLTANDGDNNNLVVTVSNIPPGAVVNVTGNNSSSPKVDFDWGTAGVPIGIYYFYLNIQDDGCPLTSSQTIAFAVNVIKPIEVSHKILFPTQCAHKAYVQLNIWEGVLPRVVTVIRNSAIVAQYTDTTGVIEDSLLKGDYDVIASSPKMQCSTTYQMHIPDSGKYLYPPFIRDRHVCVNDAIENIKFGIDTAAYNINWYDTALNPLPKVPIYKTDTPGVQTWFISQTRLVCESDKVPYSVYVHTPPITEIINKPSTVCIGDKVELIASGAVMYKWYPTDKVYTENNHYYTNIMTPTTYTVVAKSIYQCADTASVTYDKIERCCMFSYPNAFTPNGDGINDRFKVILYGNATEYLFSIYNRWGQQVFSTQNPKEGWDGYFKGQSCELGVYYYRVKGTCITGHLEEQAGEFTLFR
ncbi:MAG: gliding motility-associated C-terminal domain-containing protein [Bacteroidetes bacterium]|nr:gliding motility-associated C-terminal domain-containing protein [Bacteroidota bacterium]